MRIVVAPDSFKGTLTNIEACQAISEGVREALPDAEVIGIPLSDGGDGVFNAIVSPEDERRDLDVTGPNGEPVGGHYFLNEGGRRAVFELAVASGLILVPRGQRDILKATTYGTGQLMRDALDRNEVGEWIVGIGGSATNDGGCGMAQALGYRFIDRKGGVMPAGLGGGALAEIRHIDADDVPQRLRDTKVIALCDVDNPLLGSDGAAHTYAPQKGASSAQVELLEDALGHLADLFVQELGVRVADIPGSGAAGGVGAGLVAFTGAELMPGADEVIRLTGLEERCSGADAVITGEGRLDEQSLHGKVPAAVAAMAMRLALPVYVIAGQVRLSPSRWRAHFRNVTAVSSGEGLEDVEPADKDEASRCLTEHATMIASAWFRK